ncbi:MAG TPA: hypothetical protein VFV75_03860 [Candidatus Polarisedimenticolaceae bacterium]|nr:hypothetical protein [Candidatus Polarisedimenticolaceae bacterium]
MSCPSGSTAREGAGCRLREHEDPALGRVLEVVLSGRQEPDFWEGVREVLRDAVAQRAPHYLVFDLRALDCLVGSALLGGLVAGALAMKEVRRPGRTAVVATGKLAGRLGEAISLCKLDDVLGGVHPDLESALGALFEDPPAATAEHRRSATPEGVPSTAWVEPRSSPDRN